MCHEMNIFFMAHNNQQVLAVHERIVFTIFCFLFDEKIKLKFLACFFEITVFNKFENPTVTTFKDPKALILTLEMLTRSRR
jgi:hypothetical protein